MVDCLIFWMKTVLGVDVIRLIYLGISLRCGLLFDLWVGDRVMFKRLFSCYSLWVVYCVLDFWYQGLIVVCILCVVVFACCFGFCWWWFCLVLWMLTVDLLLVLTLFCLAIWCLIVLIMLIYFVWVLWIWLIVKG